MGRSGEREDHWVGKLSYGVSVVQDLEELSKEAAELFVDAARRAAHKHGRFSVLLSGGETPRRCYELLARKPWRTMVPWHAVQVFWGDERYVPPGDPRNNAQMARSALLDHVPLSADQIHPIPFCGSALESALAYETTLRGYFQDVPPRFDLSLLGLGLNGHTASLFPGTPVLEESERWVSEVYLAETDQHRITLTPQVLNHSGLTLFLVSGAEKAAILQEVLDGPQDPQRLPAQLIRPEHGKLLWLVDREAGHLLRKSSPTTGEGNDHAEAK